MNFNEVVKGVIEDRQAKIAYPIVGVVTSYYEETHMVTVRCTSRTGNAYILYELPWLTEPTGIYNSAPEAGLHVVIDFRMGDPEHPVITSRYDPWYKTTIREEAKRTLETLGTRTTGNIMK